MSLQSLYLTQAHAGGLVEEGKLYFHRSFMSHLSPLAYNHLALILSMLWGGDPDSLSHMNIQLSHLLKRSLSFPSLGCSVTLVEISTSIVLGSVFSAIGLSSLGPTPPHFKACACIIKPGYQVCCGNALFVSQASLCEEV